ncbi:unnamed protein product, partial [Candidula unifasciata]
MVTMATLIKVSKQKDAVGRAGNKDLPAMISLIQSVFIVLALSMPTVSFEVHLTGSHIGETIVNSSLPGYGWRYTIDSPSSKRSLAIVSLRTPYSGVIQQRKKLDCRKTKANLLQFQVSSTRDVIQPNSLTRKMSCVIPYSVFIHGRLCKAFHKDWLWKKMKETAHHKHTVFIQVPSSDFCFTSKRTILSLYDIIPFHFHSCDINIIPRTLNVNINPRSLDMTFSEDLCVNDEVRVELQLTFVCQKSVRQFIHYFITFHKESNNITSTEKSLNRRKRQNGNRAPSFARPQYIQNIKEEQEPGMSVITITATDPDIGEAGTLTYKMEANEDLRSSDMFVINSSSGLIKTKQVLDRETMSKHSFTIYATDNAQPVSERRSATTYLSIIVDDVNDHDPTFTPSSSRININENRSPRQEFTVAAVDEDTGDNAMIRYSILNPAYPNNAFMIDPLSGTISTLHSLDREKVSSYKLLILAMDQGDLNQRRSSTYTLWVNVADENDNSPMFLKSSYTVSLPENQAPSVAREIINVTAVDADAGDNALVSYRLTGAGQETFNISQFTGQLYLTGTLDYENIHEYALNIRADDKGNPSKWNSTTVLVKVLDVNDNVPSFLEPSYQTSINENIPVGSVVITVQADDQDSDQNAVIKYSVVNPPSSFPFELDPHTGVIKTRAQVDRETNSSFVFQVKAEDSGKPPLSSSVTVSIRVNDLNDNAPVFKEKSYNASISEEAVKGDPVITVSAQDRDEGSNALITYRITGGNDKDAFQIRPREGVISVNRKLDAREQNRYVLTVSAQDGGGQSDSVDVTIFVLDTNRFAPKFQRDQQYFFDVSEDVTVGKSVFQVLALDDDVGENARITYSLSPMPVFTIDPNTGVITTRQRLDRETVSLYALTVTATDNGKPSRSATAEISVTVKDVNDNKPEFSKYKYEGSVSEDALPGFKILNITAVDKDEGINGQVRYTFEGGNDGNGAFSIDNQGWIRLAKEIDREVKPSYDLVALAIDLDPVHPQSSSVVIHIDVLDVNDNSPIFQTKEFVVMIDENTPIGSTVAVISAVDPDVGINALVDYTIASGGDSDKFQLAGRRDDPAIIKSMVQLDYEEGKKEYEITLRAASGTRISSAKVIIKVQDVNDNPPILEDFSIIFNNFGGMFPSGPIGRIPAFDPDVSDRDRLVYKILSGNKAELLHLNETSGEVTLDPRLNSDVPRTGMFQISVS